MKTKTKKPFLALTLLFFVGIFLTVVYQITINFHFLSLETNYSIGKIKNYTHYEIIKGDIIAGEIDSKYPNLGIIKLRFDTANRINKNILSFRLKEIGADSWYYQARYNTDQFRNDQLFPIGFPLIKDSNGKKYLFEFESLDGATGSAVALSGRNPSYVSEHVFTRPELVNNKRLFLYFLFNKTVNLLSDPQFVFHLIIYFLPFLFCLLNLIFGISYQIPSLIVFLTIFWDIFGIKENYDLLIIAIIFGWSLTSIKFQIESGVSFSISIILLTFSMMFNLVGFHPALEKTFVWTFLFFIFYLIQMWLEELKAFPKPVQVHENHLDIASFWTGLIDTPKNIHLEKKGEIKINICEFWTGLIDTPRVLMAVYKRLRNSGRLGKLTFIIVTVLPWIILLNLVQKLIHNNISYYKFYDGFYPENQFNLYFYKTGIWLMFLYFISIIITLAFIRRIRKISVVYFCIILAFLTKSFASQVFNITTPKKYNAIIWHISSGNVSEPWQDVYIDGRNFSDLPFRGKVYIDKVEQRIIGWTNKEITFRTDPLTTRSGRLCVETFYGEKSNQTDFFYTGNR